MKQANSILVLNVCTDFEAQTLLTHNNVLVNTGHSDRTQAISEELNDSLHATVFLIKITFDQFFGAHKNGYLISDHDYIKLGNAEPQHSDTVTQRLTRLYQAQCLAGLLELRVFSTA